MRSFFHNEFPHLIFMSFNFCKFAMDWLLLLTLTCLWDALRLLSFWSMGINIALLWYCLCLLLDGCHFRYSFFGLHSVWFALLLIAVLPPMCVGVPSLAFTLLLPVIFWYWLLLMSWLFCFNGFRTDLLLCVLPLFTLCFYLFCDGLCYRRHSSVTHIVCCPYSLHISYIANFYWGQYYWYWIEIFSFKIYFNIHHSEMTVPFLISSWVSCPQI